MTFPQPPAPQEGADRLRAVLAAMDDDRFAHLPIVERHNADAFRSDVQSVLSETERLKAEVERLTAALMSVADDPIGKRPNSSVLRSIARAALSPTGGQE